MNQTTQREQVRQCASDFFSGDVLTDDDLDHIERSAPALFCLIERKAARPKPDARTVTDEFLRTLPEPLFDHLLVLALGFFRRNARGVEGPENLAPELGSVAFFLWLIEQGLEGYAGTDEELYALMDRFARLVLLEEQRRAGAFVWVNRYSMSARVTDDWPPRLPVTDRRTEH